MPQRLNKYSQLKRAYMKQTEIQDRIPVITLFSFYLFNFLIFKIFIFPHLQTMEEGTTDFLVYMVH